MCVVDRSFARERGIAEFGTSRTEGKGGSLREAQLDQVFIELVIAAEPPESDREQHVLRFVTWPKKVTRWDKRFHCARSNPRLKPCAGVGSGFDRRKAAVFSNAESRNPAVLCDRGGRPR